MGPPEQAPEPALVRQEHDDVGPFPCQLLLSPRLPHPPPTRAADSLSSPSAPLPFLVLAGLCGSISTLRVLLMEEQDLPRSQPVRVHVHACILVTRVSAFYLCAAAREARLAHERCGGVMLASGLIRWGSDVPTRVCQCACTFVISRVLPDTPRAQLPAVLPERRPLPAS